jgi:hypothetical protein
VFSMWNIIKIWNVLQITGVQNYMKWNYKISVDEIIFGNGVISYDWKTINVYPWLTILLMIDKIWTLRSLRFGSQYWVRYLLVVWAFCLYSHTSIQHKIMINFWKNYE